MSLLDLVVRTQVSEALGWTLIHTLWEGAIVAAVLAALLVSVRSAQIRYAAACAAMLALLAGFIITLMHFLPEHGGGAGAMVKAASTDWMVRPELGAGAGQFQNSSALVSWLSVVWTAGVGIFYLRYAAGWLALYRVRRRRVCSAPDAWQGKLARLALELRVSRPVKLLETLAADTPVVLGHFRPVVLVPLGFLAGLPPDYVEAILLHELAHIRRSDYLVNIVQRIVEGLLFYHPAVWWISHVVRAQRENCCDDVVVHLRGDAHGYARALAALEQNRVETRWAAPAASVAATGGTLMKRVKRLLYPQDSGGFWAPALAAAVLLAGASMLMAAWHVNSGAVPAGQQADQTVQDPWQKWLDEDVVYIISKEEKVAFEQLKDDEERQQFIVQFWERRNPNPGSAENKFKEEYYRRIAYVNMHFRSDRPGWKTDRGRIYILYGPPDEIDSHPGGGSYTRPESEGGGKVTACPFEDWRYSHFQNIGSLTIEFIDPSHSGEFRMTLDPKEKYKRP